MVRTDMKNSTEKLLSVGLEKIGIALDFQSQQKLLHFLEFLQKWNRTYNLTAITEMEKMISYHLLDSLAIAPYISGNFILDVGSGAGFPGIPLSVLFPEKQWVLLDSNGKKARFLTQAKVEFKLHNVEIIHQRVESWQSSRQFDQIMARAVGTIVDIIDQTQHLIDPNGSWLLLKSTIQAAELESLKINFKTYPLEVPGVSGVRQVVIVKKSCY